MRTVTIALRELRERSRLFLICAALAVVPFFAAVLPAASADRSGVIAAVSSFLAMALALGTSIAFGASTIARDLVERRLSFYFSKPVSPASIWLGKAAAAILSSYACFAIIALPGALAAPRVWPMLWMMTKGQIVAIAAVGVVILFLLGHLLASVIRSRSPLIAVDFVLAVIAAGTVVLLARPLLARAAVELTGVIGTIAGAAFLFLAAVAPIRQLSQGRTDIRRSHAALSRALWPPLFVVLALLGLYVLWVVSVKPSDLASVLYLEQPPRGERAYVFGTTRGRGDYHASFLLDARGSWRRVSAAPWSQVAFSRDGRVAAWLEPVGLFRSVDGELHTDRGPTNIRARVFSELVLSDDGSRIAVADGRLVAVHDLRTGRLLASAGGLEGGLQHAMFFVSNDLLRVIESNYRRAGMLRILELDMARKKLTVTGEARVDRGDAVIASPDGSRLLLRNSRKVVDGRTAATIAELPPGDKPAGALLRDGRAVDVRFDNETARLRVIGGPEVVLPAGVASVVGELPDGMLLVSAAKHTGWSSAGKDRMLFVVDPNRGAILRTVHDVKGPQSRWWAADPRLVRFDAALLAGVDVDGKPVWLEPKSGRTVRPPQPE